MDTHRSRRRLGIGLAALALLASAFALKVSACDGSSSEALGPGIWVAMVQPAPDASQEPYFRAPIRVFDAISGKERQFGPASMYFVARWSPAGDRLAAIAADFADGQPTLSIRIWNARGDHVADRSYEGKNDLPSSLAWSPDGSRLAVTMGAGVAMVNSSGRELGETRATPGADGGMSSRGVIGGSPWSPDSEHFAVAMNEVLLVIDRDGSGKEHEFPPGNPAQPRSLAFNGWRGPETLLALGLGGEPFVATEYEGTLRAGRLAWDGGKPADANGRFPDEQRMAEYAQLLPGLRWVGERRSADGSALVVRLAGDERGTPFPAPFGLAVELDGATMVIDLGFANRRDGGPDVLIRRGWKGTTPSVVNAATPFPAAAAAPRR